MKTRTKILSLIGIIIITFLALCFRVKISDSCTAFDLEARELGHLAYDAFVLEDTNAANRISAYYQFCTDEIAFGEKWLTIGENISSQKCTRCGQ